jgi:ribonucleotide monophosphatase NagD (HAD superfamily)
MATGPLVKAIEYASQKRAVVIGKPSRLMFSIALHRAGSEKGDAVMVGDQADTDILGASRAGIDAILVTTGIDQDAPGLKLLAKLSNVDDLVPLL